MATQALKTRKIRLGELLVQHKLISEAELQAALDDQKRSGRKLGRVLVSMGAVREEELLELLSRQLRVPLIDLKQYRFDAEVARLLPEQYARRFRTLVIADEPDGFRVAMADPTDIFAFDELGRILRRPLKLSLAREHDILDAIDLVYRHTEQITHLAEELSEELGTDYDLQELVAEELETDAPVARLLQSVFDDAVRSGASDIHIEPEDRQLRIRQRIDGLLHEQVLEGARAAQALVTRLKLLSNLDISEKRLPQDGRFSIRVGERFFDVRLSTMPVATGEAVTMRLLDQSTPLRGLTELGMPPEMLRETRRLLTRPHGIFLVSGPTGSGKTTTLYGALDELNKPERKIITAEDPVEYRLPRINQIQVNSRIDLDFARILRSALRQDPDIIMIGEIRDEETVDIALRAAITGHLVLSTIHTNNTQATLSRLLDMGAKGYLIAAALQAVIAQRLVRRVCQRCTSEHALTPQESAFLAALRPEAQPSDITFRSGKGCAYCNDTGYRGRQGVFELLEITPSLADAIRREASVEFADAAIHAPSYRPLVQSAIDSAIQGVTTLEEAIRIHGESQGEDLEV